MNKMVSKLIMAVLALMLAVSVAVMSTYAWMVLSANPVAEGIQITIDGGNTILVAPDITQTQEGVAYHYPGKFSEKLNFANASSYDYLEGLGGLLPVSTANGLDWILSGPDGYVLDNTLSNANLPSGATEIRQGHYIYMDFWVVSPGSDYTLRVSSDNGAGTFAIDLLSAQQAENQTGYTLSVNEKGSAAASVRVGFLVDDSVITDNTMTYYQRSLAASGLYTQLKGAYGADRDNYSFYIYEPNGDYHPNAEVAEPGSYVITKPLEPLGGQIMPVSAQRNTAVQLTNSWRQTQSGVFQLEERFQTAIFGRNLSGMSVDEVESLFYSEYLQNQVAAYVNAASFVNSTELLYEAATDGIVSAENLSSLTADSATDDAYIIRLEKNVPQRIRMFLWLEGQDVDCASSAYADSFALGLELAGGSV